MDCYFLQYGYQTFSLEDKDLTLCMHLNTYLLEMPIKFLVKEHLGKYIIISQEILNTNHTFLSRPAGSRK